MSNTTVIGSGDIKDFKSGCGWMECKGCTNAKPPGNDNGDIKRKDRKGINPWAKKNSSYEEFGIKVGYTTGFSSESLGIKNRTTKAGAKESYAKGDSSKIVKHNVEDYATQFHHVISVNLMEKFNLLAHNLKLVGWDINHVPTNGINLPYFREDMIWHYLQTHRGSHPQADYYDKIEVGLKKLHSQFKGCCTNDKLEYADLKNCMEWLSQEYRNQILQWKINVHAKDTTQKIYEEFVLDQKLNTSITKNSSGKLQDRYGNMGYYYEPDGTKPSALLKDAFAKSKVLTVGERDYYN